jgi:hypothetical protein
MMTTRTTSTGHFARDHTVSAVSPMPSQPPACRARPPVKTTMRALATAISIRTTVTPTRTGSTFHTGRPSGTS